MSSELAAKPGSTVAGDARTEADRKAAGQRVRWLLSRVLPLPLFLLLWEALVNVFHVPRFLVPPPSAIYAQLVRDWNLVWMHTKVTLLEIGLGYAAAVIGGIAVALIVVKYRWLEETVFPYLVASQTLPKIAIAPLIIIWFGSGWVPKVLLVGLMAFFPVAVNTIAGFKAVERGYLDLSRSVAAREKDVFTKVRIPYAVPYIFAGLKLASTRAVMGAVVAEFVGSSAGLGYFILAGNYSFEVARVFVGLLALIFIGIALFALAGLCERLFSWRAVDTE